MKKYTVFILLTFLFLLFISPNKSTAQSLEETLSKLSATAGKAYVAPVVSGFGSNLNSGWVSKLPESTFLGFHLDLKFIGAGSFFTDAQKTFNANGNFYFNSQQVDAIINNSNLQLTTQQRADLKNAMLNKEFTVNFSGPTIVGSENEKLHIDFPKQNVTANGQSFPVESYTVIVDEVKGLLKGLSILPTPGVQLTGGTVYGTNVSLRFVPSIKVSDELGDFSLFGIGAIHNINGWIPNPLPIDLGVGYFYQKLKVGDVFEGNASQFGVYAGKTFGIGVTFSPFIGLTVESFKTSVKYDYKSNQTVNGAPVAPVKINFDSEGENTTGVTVGFSLKLAIVNINADYKIAKTKTASAGISFGF